LTRGFETSDIACYLRPVVAQQLWQPQLWGCLVDLAEDDVEV
jgi:hypothetical protein